jgi:S-(hydroxymethyl)glutathione dehydrogenase/alcohol dehydrogenase
MLDGTYRMHARGQDVGSGSRLASFSQFTVMPETACVPIPKDVDLVSACLVGCGVSTGMGAALNIAGVRPGDSVAVFGVGGVGMAALVGSVIGGAGQVIAIDIKEAKLDRARSFGATDVVNASMDDPVETIRALTEGWGVDKAILCIDHVGPRHLSDAVDCLDSCGTAVLCGAVDFALDYLPVRPAAMMREQKTFTATLYGGTDPATDALRYIELHRAGRLPLERFVTATYPLERINQAFDDMVAGRNIRGVIVYD